MANKDFTNRKLAVLLIGAILISVAGTMVSLNHIEGTPTGVTGAVVDDTSFDDVYDGPRFTQEELDEMTPEEIDELIEEGLLPPDYWDE